LDVWVIRYSGLFVLQSGTYGNPSGMDVALINMLRIEVANAVSRADQVTAAQLQEAIRTVQQLGVDGLVKIQTSSEFDYHSRSKLPIYF